MSEFSEKEKDLFGDHVRRERAKDAKMYLVNFYCNSSPTTTPGPTPRGTREHLFEVSGSTGNLYVISLKYKGDASRPRMSCTCPDYARRRKLCKHIYFVLDRVLHFEDLQVSFDSPDYVNFEAIARLKNAFLTKSAPSPSPEPRPIEEDEECVICFELLVGENLSSCSTCRYSFHATCTKIMLAAQKKSDLPYSCPLCRGQW